MAYKCSLCNGINVQVRKFCWVWATDPKDPDCLGDMTEVDYESNNYEFWCCDCEQHDTEEEIEPAEYHCLRAAVAATSEAKEED